MNKKERFDEAIKRMKLLKLDKQCIEAFTKGKVWESEGFGALYEVNDEEQKIINKFEANHKDGDIIKQSKPEGYQVTQGTTLTITIYKAPDDSEKCNPNEEVCD